MAVLEIPHHRLKDRVITIYHLKGIVCGVS